MRPWLLRLAAIALLLGIPPFGRTERALACDCEPPTLLEALEYADAVFAGQVTAATFAWGEFEVSRVWKGDVEATTRVYVEEVCGLSFREGEELIVFAYVTEGDESQLSTENCSGTGKLTQDEIALLGNGQPPGTGPVVLTLAEAAPPDPGDTGTGTVAGRCASDRVAFGLPTVGAVALVVLIFVSRRRRTRHG